MLLIASRNQVITCFFICDASTVWIPRQPTSKLKHVIWVYNFLLNQPHLNCYENLNFDQSNVWRNLESWLIEPRWNGSQNLNIISCLCCFFTDCPSIPQYLEDNYSLGCPTFGFQPVLYFQWQEDEKPFVYTFNLPSQWSHIPLTYRWS